MQAYEIGSGYSAHVESDQADERTININGMEFRVASDTDAEKVRWQNGTLDCGISGTVSPEEMRQMILSIYGGD